MVRHRYARRSSSSSGGWKGALLKAAAGAGLATVLGKGILGLGASWFVAGVPGVAGALLGDQAKNLTGGVKASASNLLG